MDASGPYGSGGGDAARRCPACGAEAPPGQRFCGECGRALEAAEGERKQLTVLFADVKGSMELQETLDPEVWSGIVGRLVTILTEGVRRFGGTVDKFTGDGVMALFGAPVAQEDHARRACHTAWWLTGAIEKYSAELRAAQGVELDIRLGLSSGEAIVGRVGEDVQLDATALGHTVGLAQRMESLAEPGRAYMTERTARLVDGWFRLGSVGAREVKGSSRPIHVYALEGLAEEPPVARRPTGTGPSPLVGRDREVRMLESALAEAIAGHGQVVGVVGEAGVGKSRLCHEFTRSAAAAGLTVRHTTGVSHGKEVPLLPVLSLLRHTFGVTEGDAPEEARRKIRERVLALHREFDELLPVLFDFLEVPDPSRPVAAASPEMRMRRISEALRRVMTRRSEREALVLLIEDLHWFDPQSEVFLETLMDAYSETRTLVLTNFRPEFSPPWAGRTHYRELPLAPLADAGVETMLCEFLGEGQPVAALRDWVVERSGGNPFFVEELVRTLVEDGTLAGARGSYRLVRPLEETRVPEGVHAVIAARIDRLSADHKALLQGAAVIGRTFSRALLARATGRTEVEIVDGLDALCGVELIQPTEYEADGYRFWHPLTQEVAYSTLLVARRAKLHAAVAEAMIVHESRRLDEVAAVVAWHWERAGKGLEAARWNLRAGEFAARTDLAEAQRRWRAATTMLSDLERTRPALEIGVRARTRLLQFGARTGIDLEEAQRLYSEGRAMAEALDDVTVLGPLVIMAGSVRFWRGDVQAALGFVREADALRSHTDDPDLMAALSFGPGFVLAYAGSPVEGIAATEQLLAIADRDPARGASLLGYSPLARTHQVRGGMMARAGRLHEALAEVEAALRLARPRGETDTVAWALAVMAHLDWLRGEGEAGRLAAADALRLAEDTGNVGALVLALEAVALTRLMSGEPEVATGACSRALRAARDHQSGLFVEPRLLVHLGVARLQQVQPSEALAAADEALALAQRRSMQTDACAALWVRGGADRRLGRPDRAAAALRSALDLARQIGARTYEPFILEEAARLSGDEPGLEAARGLYAEIGATGHARRLQAEIASSTPARP